MKTNRPDYNYEVTLFKKGEVLARRKAEATDEWHAIQLICSGYFLRTPYSYDQFGNMWKFTLGGTQYAASVSLIQQGELQ